MTMSLMNAIRSIKQDEKWLGKIIVGGLVCLVAQIAGFCSLSFIAQKTAPGIGTLIGLIISIVAALWIVGFIFSSMNKTINSDKFQMAELNESNIILTGLKSFMAIIGWGILATIILFVVEIVYFALIAIFCFILGFISGLIGVNNQILTILIAIFCIIASVVLGLYIAQFVNTAFALYFKRLELGDLISFKKQFVIIKENQHANWTLIGKMILFSLAYQGIIIALSVTIVGLVLVPFVAFAGYFVAYNLVAQYAKEINIDKYLEAK